MTTPLTRATNVSTLVYTRVYTRVKRLLLCVLTAVIGLWLFAPAADAAVELAPGLNVYGDARARVEYDEKSSFAGTDEERDRLRYRLRVGFTFDMSEYPIQFGARAVSGNADAISHHVTLGNEDYSKHDLNIDRVYVKGTYAGGWAWFGKNSIPMWLQNDYFWDLDAGPEGIAAGYTFKDVGPIELTLQGGHFVLKDGGWRSDGAGNTDLDLWSAQIVAKAALEPLDLTFGYGVLHTDPGACVRGTNGWVTPAVCGDVLTLDAEYSIASIEAKLKGLDPIGITLGFDYMTGDVDSTVPNDDEDSGYVATIKLTRDKKCSLKVQFIELDLHAVLAFAQDDFPNFYSDFEGTAITLAHKFTDSMNIQLIRYDGQRNLSEIAGGYGPTDPEEEERYRVNFNLKF